MGPWGLTGTYYLCTVRDESSNLSGSTLGMYRNRYVTEAKRSGNLKLTVEVESGTLVGELFGVTDSLAEALFGTPVAGENATLVPALA